MSKRIIPIIMLLLVLAFWPVSGVQCETVNSMTINWEFVEKQEFIIGVLPYGTDDGIFQDLKPLADYLEFHLQRPVKIHVAVDYQSLGKLLIFSKIQSCMVQSCSFENSPASSSWEIICRPERANSLRVGWRDSGQGNFSLPDPSGLSEKRIAYVSVVQEVIQASRPSPAWGSRNCRRRWRA